MVLIIPALAALALSVSFLLRAEFAADRRGICTWKPIASAAMTALLLAAFLRADGSGSGYALAMLPGMLLCAGGDMALMFMNESKKAFRIGLALFLLGHLGYAAALAVLDGFRASDWTSAIPLAAAGAGIFLYLRPRLGDMKGPVLLYVLVICVMANRALSSLSGDYLERGRALLLALGAILFFVSDVILALHRFRHQWRYGRINLAFYYAGQALIALSASLL